MLKRLPTEEEGRRLIEAALGDISQAVSIKVTEYDQYSFSVWAEFPHSRHRLKATPYNDGSFRAGMAYQHIDVHQIDGGPNNIWHILEFDTFKFSEVAKEILPNLKK